MTDEIDNAWGVIVAKCWEDKTFKERLLADPAATLAEEGVELPEGVTVRVVVESATERVLVVPPAPTRELCDAELAGIHGGFFFPRECPTREPPSGRPEGRPRPLRSRPAGARRSAAAAACSRTSHCPRRAQAVSRRRRPQHGAPSCCILRRETTP